ncbi:hypothetical protein HY640_04635 [Candidatus Woesearchaeota archaeon]|nr:hypothetical protein [Candidatus Woesearchaeota archaeon]
MAAPYVDMAREFFFDKQFINLLVSTTFLFMASLAAWYIYYKQLAKRDLFAIPKIKLNTRFTDLIDKGLYYLKYLFIFPVYCFIWFLIFSFLLFALSKSKSIDDVMFLAVILVSATRMSAYVSEKLAEDIAKLLPLTLIAVFLMDPKAVNTETVMASIPAFMSHAQTAASYLFFIIILEWALRISRRTVLWLSGDASRAAKEATKYATEKKEI